VGVFLVEAYCLGVNNAFFARIPEHKYEKDMLGRVFAESSKAPLTAACGRKLVEEAVAYARGLGPDPHPDYKKAGRAFGGIDPAGCGRTFTFGKDGKPFSIEGPHDSPQFVRHVLASLQRRCGEGNFHYMVVAKDLPKLDGLHGW
jgi:hypothetical protein